MTGIQGVENASLAEAVIRRLDGCDDPRLKEVLTSLVRHLHAFIREIEPTEAEWLAGIDFLTRTGLMCDARRQEFILLSDTLGVSMLVDAINHRFPDGATATTVQGPFYVADAPAFPLGADIAAGCRGRRLLVEGVVLTSDGSPIAGATVDVWQSDDEGFYDLQRPERGEPHLRGRFTADSNGRFWFWSIVPAFYPIPTDGPVGALLTASGRHPYRPAHIHFMVQARGYQRLVTHVFVEGDPYLDSDAVFGVKESLIRPFVQRDGGAEPDGTPITGEHHYVSHPFQLNAVRNPA